MREQELFENRFVSPKHTYWLAILSLFMGVSSLITSEFIPISLLTPIAHDLSISEGLAGQSITMVGIFAVIASLLLSPVAKHINRKIILLGFSVIVIVSNLIVAFSLNYTILLIGRGLLGICVGGFWSMTSAVTLQLATSKDISRALSIIYAGVSVATIIALPLSSYIGNIMGWRNVFIIAALMGLVSLIWQLLTLPSLPAQKGNSFSSMFNLLKQQWISIGILAIISSYGGYHIVFSYLRPWLQNDLQLASNIVTLTLLLFGIANCAGTVIAGYFLGQFFKITMFVVHLLFFVIAITLFFSKDLISENLIMIIVWGLLFGFIPVGWTTWITRTLSNKAELMGGLSVAAIQLSIGMATAIGGNLYDYFGRSGLFIASAGVMLLAILFIHYSFSIYLKMMKKPV
ncbi:MFS transporter [Gilliamella sp. wkB108]|uniref:MFS transporter n=1 Tax=Gilliamella sp. wkB108 TaxID=3120256 RepID=UPI00080E8E8D|nr:MFS transporter [Gilliamella apicola]OCG22180.1 MFS transporter [Gilliamella apicola]